MEIFSGLIRGATINTIVCSILLIIGIIHSLSNSTPKTSFLLILFVTIGFWQFIYLIPLTYKYENESLGILISSLFGIMITTYNWNFFKIKNRIKIDSFNQTILEYDKLPEIVKRELKELHSNNNKSFSSTDENIKISYHTTTMDDGLWKLAIEGFNHHFNIEDNHYTLNANKGIPFILHENSLYHPMNMNSDEKFIQIKLKK